MRPTHANPPDVTIHGTVIYHTTRFGPVVLQPGPNGRFATRDGTDLPTDVKALEDIGCDISPGLRIALVRREARHRMERERAQQEREHNERMRQLEQETVLREQELIRQGLVDSGVEINPYGAPGLTMRTPPPMTPVNGVTLPPIKGGSQAPSFT